MSGITDKFICLLYRDLLLPWETGFSKKQFPNINAIEKFLPTELTLESMKKQDQMLVLKNAWKARKDQYVVLAQGANVKTHLLIRMLRNAFAHGDMTARTRNKTRMIYISHTHEGNLALFGQMTEHNLQILISTIMSRVR